MVTIESAAVQIIRQEVRLRLL